MPAALRSLLFFMIGMALPMAAAPWAAFLGLGRPWRNFAYAVVATGVVTLFYLAIAWGERDSSGYSEFLILIAGWLAAFLVGLASVRACQRALSGAGST